MFYIKRFFKHLGNFISWGAKWIISLVFVALILGGIYIAYSDIQASKAKEYISDKYDLQKIRFYAYKTTEYVYEENTDCSTLWFKKCSDDVDKYKDITFIVLGDGFKKIHVTETRDGVFTDDYEKEDK